jgi:hypothetical protein
MTKSKCVAIELVAIFAVSILAAPFMATAEETGGKSATAAGKEDKPPESKRIDLGDGLVLKEYREFKKGKVVVLIKTYERNGETIMRQTSMPGENDMWTLFRDGKEVVSQQIDDKGRVVNLVVSRDDGSWHEIFERQIDGAVAPIGTARLQQVRKHTDFMRKNFTPFADAVKKGDKKEADVRLDSMIEKIKAGEFDATDQEPSDAAK